MRQCPVERCDGLDGQFVVEELGAEMLFGGMFQQPGGVVPVEGGESLFVGVDRHMRPGQRCAQLRKVGEAAAVDDQAVEGVADAHAARLGVADHGTSLFEVAVDVEIGVDDAGARFDDRDAGVLADEADQPRPAARDDYVDETRERHELVGCVMRGALDALNAVLGKPRLDRRLGEHVR